MFKNQHILVYRLSAMGDVAMIVPVLRVLIQQYPDVKITVASRKFLKPLFHDLDRVSFISVDDKGAHKGIGGLYKLHRQLKQLGVTHMADLHNVLRSKIVRNFFKISNIPVAYIDKGRAAKKALTRIENKVFKPLKTSHQRYADVFAQLGFPIDISKPVPAIISPLNENVLQITGPKIQQWIGIAPFAAFPSKVYPLDLMEQVIAQLDEQGYQLFLFGGKADMAILEPLAQQYPNTHNVAGKLGGLQNELNLIAHLDVMLSMDSGNAHLAAMQQVKTITLWGGTHPYAGFAPYGQPDSYCILPDLEKYPNLPCSIYGNKVCEGYEDVMRSIVPKVVVQKIIEVTKKSVS